MLQVLKNILLLLSLKRRQNRNAVSWRVMRRDAHMYKLPKPLIETVHSTGLKGRLEGNNPDLTNNFSFPIVIWKISLPVIKSHD